MQTIEIQAITWKEGRQYVSQCLNVDVSSFGSTEKKALENLKEAVQLYLEDKDIRKPKKIQVPRLTSLKLAYA